MRPWLRNALVGLGLTLAGVVLFVGLAEPWLPARFVFLSRVSGGAAAAALAAALCVTPLARLARLCGRAPREAQVTTLRRALGLGAAGLSLVHVTLSLMLVLEGRVSLLYSVPRLRAGLCALLILLVLALTSFPRLVVRMRLRVWKELHVLVYVALCFVLQHLLLSPFAPRRLVLSVFAGLVLVGMLRGLPRRARSSESVSDGPQAPKQ